MNGVWVCGTLCMLMVQTLPSKESFEYAMALQQIRPLLNVSRPLQYLARTVDYVHFKIRAADVKTDCSLFSIRNLHGHSGSCFTCLVLPQNWVFVTFDQRRLT